jgi:dipeptidyl aminopeptidase/acylaminoacyl peptidase
VDAEDALAAVDALVERGLADPDRLGGHGPLLRRIPGAVARRRHRSLRGRVSENGVANQASAWANSYFGVHYNRRAGLGDPLSDEGMQALWRSSPLRNAPRIRTPLLMLQAEEDRICPPADNEQLFTALRVLDRTVELRALPRRAPRDEAIGRPDRRIDRMERILAWFGTHLRRR